MKNLNLLSCPRSSIMPEEIVHSSNCCKLFLISDGADFVLNPEGERENKVTGMRIEVTSPHQLRVSLSHDGTKEVTEERFSSDGRVDLATLRQYYMNNQAWEVLHNGS